jgi:TIR domain-containing protein/pentapeptide repeat protein
MLLPQFSFVARSAIRRLEASLGTFTMANPEHLDILKRGVKAWNSWRRETQTFNPELTKADLNSFHIPGIDLTNANLSGAYLSRAYLREAKLTGAALTGANLIGAYLYDADIRKANLTGALLGEASLAGANFDEAYLHGADLKLAMTSGTIFSKIDLSTVNGLDDVWHRGPSRIDIDTLYKSGGNISERFLRGCGVPEEFIVQIPALVSGVQPIQFYSCFISYSSKDVEFARRLHERMRAAGLRVWFAPEEMKGGVKLHEQIFSAIQVHDKLLLVLSKESMKSAWVTTEIQRARKTELKENRRKLFPIRLVDFDVIRTWECFDADTGRDLATELREYFIPDFSNWRNHDDFERAFVQLLRDLRSVEAEDR